MSAPCSADSSDDEMAAGEIQPAATTAEPAVVQTLTDHAGEVITTERDRAVRTFGGERDVSAVARRTLTTMAVRIAVGLYQTPMAAAADDEACAGTVAELFLPDGGVQTAVGGDNADSVDRR